MPEFMGHKISQSEYRARHAYRRALDKALRPASRNTGWRCARGSLFQEKSEWFISAFAGVTIFWRETRAHLWVKPMGVDPIFWDIVGAPENHAAPLSFRALGAWTCRSPAFAESTIDEGEWGAVGVAERVVSWASSVAETLGGAYSIDDYLKFLAADPRASTYYLPVLVSTLLLAGRSDEAEALCADAQQRGEIGGMNFPEGGFPTMALNYLKSRVRKAYN
jgi:hypothetical protein